MFTTGVNDPVGGRVNDDPRSPMPSFFPLTAYLQVKAISDPADDWHDRLVAATAANPLPSSQPRCERRAGQLVGTPAGSPKPNGITPGRVQQDRLLRV